MNLPFDVSTIVAAPGTSYCYIQDEGDPSVHTICNYVSPRTLIPCGNRIPAGSLSKASNKCPLAICDEHLALQTRLRLNFENGHYNEYGSPFKRYSKIVCEDSVVRDADLALAPIDTCYCIFENTHLPPSLSDNFGLGTVLTDKEALRMQSFLLDESIDLIRMNRELLREHARQMTDSFAEELASTNWDSLPNFDERTKELLLMNLRLREVEYRPQRLALSRKQQQTNHVNICTYAGEQMPIPSEYEEDDDFQTVYATVTKLIDEVVLKTDSATMCQDACIPMMGYCRKHSLLSPTQKMFIECKVCRESALDFGDDMCPLHRVEKIHTDAANSLATNLMVPLSVNVEEMKCEKLSLKTNPVSNLHYPSASPISTLPPTSDKPNQDWPMKEEADIKPPTLNTMKSQTASTASTICASRISIGTEDSTCARIRPFTKEFFNAEATRAGARKRKYTPTPREPMDRGFVQMRRIASESASAYKIAAPNGNHGRLGAEQQMFSSSECSTTLANYHYDRVRNFIPRPSTTNSKGSLDTPVQTTAPFALPATQADQYPRKTMHRFQIHYRAAESPRSSGSIDDLKGLLSRNAVPDQNVDESTASPSSTRSSELPDAQSDDSNDHRYTNENDSDSAVPASQPPDDTINENHRIFPSQSLNEPAKDGVKARVLLEPPPGRVIIPPHRLLMNQPNKRVTHMRNGQCSVVGQPQNGSGTEFEPTSPTKATSNEPVTMKTSGRMPLLPKDASQVANNLPFSSEISEKQITDLNAEANRAAEPTTAQNSIASDGLLMAKSEMTTEVGEASANHPTNVEQETSIREEATTTESSSPGQESKKLEPKSGDGGDRVWEKAISNPLDMLAYTALTQAAKSVEMRNGDD